MYITEALLSLSRSETLQFYAVGQSQGVKNQPMPSRSLPTLIKVAFNNSTLSPASESFDFALLQRELKEGEN
jgi:hypothetical protein